MFFSLGVFSTVFSQSQRTMLFEEFTGEDCGPCAAANPGVNALLNDNDGTVIGLKYQSIVSSSSRNVLYTQTKAESNARGSYYSNTSLPYGILDGNVKKSHAANFVQTDFDNRFSAPSSFNLTVNHDFSVNSDSVYITINIEASQAFSAGGASSLKLRVAMVEREITLTPPAVNGESEFVDVMRKMYPGPGGTTLAQNWANGQAQTVTFGVLIPSYIFDKNEIAIVAFIQDDITKEVQQAAQSAKKPVRLDAKADDYESSFLVCDPTGFEPIVKIKNNGSDALTYCDLDIYVDGALTSTKSWSGNLASNAEATVTLPAISRTSGAHIIKVVAKNPNLENDQNNFNDTIVSAFAFPDDAVAIPLSEDFENNIPSSFIVEPNKSGSSWKIANYSANGVGSKSILMRFYAIPESDDNYIYLPTLDLSAASFVRMTFDKAYARYNSSYNDGLEIQGSKDCGKTWISLWKKEGTALATAPNTTSEFKPSNANQWKSDTASLDYFAGDAKVFIRLKGISEYGNNLYVDNLNVETTYTTNGGPQHPTSITQVFSTNNISLFPNPSNNVVTIAFGETIETASVKIFDVRSVEMLNTLVENSSKVNVNTANFSAGLYFVQVISKNNTAKASFVVQH